MKNTYKKFNNKPSENMKSKISSSNTNTNRIAKVIARSGLCSRREAERLIIDGKVKVNNKIQLECGINVNSKDQIEVNNQPLPTKVETKLCALAMIFPFLSTIIAPTGTSCFSLALIASFIANSI